MPELHIALQSGANEQADAKILPQGRLLQAENVRLRKDGKIAPRYAYSAWTSAGTFSYIFGVGTIDLNYKWRYKWCSIWTRVYR
jgi:hypothetical protein